jgi:hypothetical protein
MRRAKGAVDALLARMQATQKSDPRFMASMRRYGLIDAIQGMLSANADLMDEVAAEYRKRGT